MTKKYEQARLTIDMPETGKRLKNFRIQRHLTISELSQATGLSIGMISETESGRNKPSPNLMLAMHRLYDLDIHWLLTGEGDEVVKEKITGPVKDEKGEPIIDENMLIWYIQRVAPVKYSVLSYFATYYYENKDFIEKILQERETGKKRE